jgi:hypothetical protein
VRGGGGGLGEGQRVAVEARHWEEDGIGGVRRGLKGIGGLPGQGRCSDVRRPELWGSGRAADYGIGRGGYKGGFWRRSEAVVGEIWRIPAECSGGRRRHAGDEMEELPGN